MSNESYQPSKEEVKQANNAMTDQQYDSSEIQSQALEELKSLGVSEEAAMAATVKIVEQSQYYEVFSLNIGGHEIKDYRTRFGGTEGVLIDGVRPSDEKNVLRAHNLVTVILKLIHNNKAVKPEDAKRQLEEAPKERPEEDNVLQAFRDIFR